jgi:hypothetical protein
LLPSERTPNGKDFRTLKEEETKSAKKERKNGNYQYQDKAKTRELSGIVTVTKRRSIGIKLRI